MRQAETRDESAAPPASERSPAAGPAFSLHGVQRLHAAVGNRAVGRMLMRAYHADKAAQSADTAQPPLAWIERPPDMARMSRVELFDAIHLIERWKPPGQSLEPKKKALRTLKLTLIERARQVTTKAEYATLRKYTRVPPERLQSLFAGHTGRAAEPGWDWDLDAIEEVLLDRFPHEAWAAQAKGKVLDGLRKKDVNVRRRFNAPAVTERATPENRQLAAAIDALDDLDAAAIRKRHFELIRAAPEQRDQRALDAIEYAVHRRGLAPVLPQFPDTSTEHRRANWRRVVEQRVRERGSLESAIKPIAVVEDVKPIKAEAQRFAPQFRSQARATAERMLKVSLEAIGKVVASYGLPVDSTELAANRVARGASKDAAAQDVIDMALRSTHVDKKRYVTRRSGLATTVKELKRAQEEHRPHIGRERQAYIRRPLSNEYESPGWKAYKQAKAELDNSEKRLATAWAKAERSHPFLSAYRSRDGLMSDLGSLDTDPVDKQMKTLLVRLLGIAADIGEAQAMLKRANGTDLALTMPAVVAVTSANMFIPPGSIRAGVVRDLVEEANDEIGTSKWAMLAAFALAIVTMVPTGGASLLMVGSASLAAYTSAAAYGAYARQKTLSNTAIDRARALVQEEPALTDFVVELVGLGLELAPLIGMTRAAIKLRRLALVGEDAADAIAVLDKMGRAHGVVDPSEKVLATVPRPARLTGQPAPVPKPVATPGRAGATKRAQPPPIPDKALTTRRPPKSAPDVPFIDLPDGSIMYGGDKPLTPVQARKMYDNAIAHTKRREAQLMWNIDTGDYIVIQGTEGGVVTAPDAWRAFASERLGGRWVGVRHYHPVGPDGITPRHGRYASGVDLVATRHDALRTGRPRSHTIDIVTEHGRQEIWYGYDPTVKPSLWNLWQGRPFWFEFRGPGGTRMRRDFRSVKDYHEWVSNQTGRHHPVSSSGPADVSGRPPPVRTPARDETRELLDDAMEAVEQGRFRPDGEIERYRAKFLDPKRKGWDTPDAEVLERGRYESVGDDEIHAGVSQMCLLRDAKTGARWLFKPELGQQEFRDAARAGIVPESHPRRAVAGEHAARQAGIATPEVRLVEWNGQRGSIQPWIDGSETLQDLLTGGPAKRALYETIVASPEYQRLRGRIDDFHYLIQSIDRNDGNFLVQLAPDGRLKRLVPIDHDRVFPPVPERLILDIAAPLPARYSRAAYQHFRAMDRRREHLTLALRGLLFEDEVQHALRRLTAILHDIETKLKTVGEAGTFLDAADTVRRIESAGTSFHPSDLDAVKTEVAKFGDPALLAEFDELRRDGRILPLKEDALREVFGVDVAKQKMAEESRVPTGGFYNPRHEYIFVNDGTLHRVSSVVIHELVHRMQNVYRPRMTPFMREFEAHAAQRHYIQRLLADGIDPDVAFPDSRWLVDATDDDIVKRLADKYGLTPPADFDPREAVRDAVARIDRIGTVGPGSDRTPTATAPGRKRGHDTHREPDDGKGEPKRPRMKGSERQPSARETAEQDKQLTTGKGPPAGGPVPRRPTLGFANRGEVHTRVKQALSLLEAPRPLGWQRVHEALQLVRQPVRDQILAELEKAMSALLNPALYADVLADAWRLVRNGTVTDINAALTHMVHASTGRRVVVLPGSDLLHPPTFFTDVISNPASWIDKGLAGDGHGEMTHVLQDLVVDRALGAGRSGEFRALLGQATERVERDLPVVRPGREPTLSPFALLPGDKRMLPNIVFAPDETSLPVGDYVWRFTYDLFYPKAIRLKWPRLPQPEAVKPQLNFLGLE